MLAEARQALPALKEAAVAPAGDEGVTRVVSARFVVYPQREMTVEESVAWWTDYFDALSDLPEAAIEAGMRAWVREGASEFMPKPGQLRQLALETENRPARAYERARRAVEYQPPRQYALAEILPTNVRILRDEPSAAEKRMVRAMMDQYRQHHEATRPPAAPERQPTFGAVDEGGLTAAMRAKIARDGHA